MIDRNIKVVIVGESDWVSYQFNSQDIIDCGKEYSAELMDDLIGTIGKALETDGLIDRGLEVRNRIVPNYLSAYICRTEFFNKLLKGEQREVMVYYGCFKLMGYPDNYIMRLAGMVSNTNEPEDIVIQQFWLLVEKFAGLWMTDNYHKNSIILRMMKTLNNLKH